MVPTDRQKEIRATWDAIEDVEPDISDERLMQMTAEACGCDVGDVSEAIMEDDE